jgi:hypothetical protein
MTIRKILNEMAKADLNGIDFESDSVKTIAKKYIDNYEKRSKKPFTIAAANASKQAFKNELSSEKIEQVLDVLKSLSKKEDSNNLQSRVTQGISMEEYLVDKTNAVKENTKIGELYINGQSLNSIINTTSDFNLKKADYSINLNNKSDLKVDAKTWLWNSDGTAVKDVFGNIASARTKPLFIEVKSTSKQNPIVKGTMLFELGKVSTYGKAYDILCSLGVLKENKEEKELLKAKRETAEIDTRKNALQSKISLSLNKIRDAQQNVNDFMKRIIDQDNFKKSINDKMKTLDNHFVVIANGKEVVEGNKIKVIEKMSDYSIDFLVTTWKGFGRIKGSFGELMKESVGDGLTLEVSFSVMCETIHKNKSVNIERISLQKAASIATDSIDEHINKLVKELINV